MKTFGFGSIDWTGFKSVLLHTFWAAVVAIVLALIDTLSHHNWGQLQPYLVPIFTFLVALVKKTAETYSVVPPDTTATVDESTGAVAPADDTTTK